MLHVLKTPHRKVAKRRFLLINPPLREPAIQQENHVLDDADSSPPPQPGAGSVDEEFRRRGYSMPLPIGLLRIANTLLRQGNDVYFLDCFSTQPPAYPSSMHRVTRAGTPDWQRTERTRVRTLHLGLPFPEIDRLLSHINVDEVYVGCTFTYQNEPAHQLISLVKKRMPDTPLTFGGIYPTLAPEEAGRSDADTVAPGPYPGMEPEDLPLNYAFLGHPPPFVLVKGTQGCPNHCAYCAVHILEGNRFQHRAPDDVIREISDGYQQYGLTKIGMWDSNLLMRYGHYLQPVLHYMTESEIPFTLSAPEGLDYRLMTDTVAHDLKRAGLQIASLALENVEDEYARNTLNRNNSTAKLKDAVASLKTAGFKAGQIRLFVMVGTPGQTLDNVLRNIRFAWDLGCNVSLFTFTPIPGTPMFETMPPAITSSPLSKLHPILLPCVDDDGLADALWELTALNSLNARRMPQTEHVHDVIRNPDLLRMLG
jgi:radical SAM superfamily enzyme YgiQ (UPF0313 family)